MKRLALWGSLLGLSYGSALLTGACGSSEQKLQTRGDGGASGETSAPPIVAGKPNAGSGGSLVPSLGGEGGSSSAVGGGGAESVAGAGASEGGVAGSGSDAAGAGGTGSDVAGAASEAGAGGAGGASDAPRFRVFNTGVDASGLALPGGSVDPHYTLLQSPEPTLPGPDAIVTTHIAEGYWLAQSEVSKWIAPSPNQSYPGATPCNASGVYVWRTTFDVAESELPTFEISGGWASDNTGTAIRLNGVELSVNDAGYTSLTTFTIEAGFVAGTNTLDFEVNDVGCPNGLRVELLASVDQ